MERDVADIGEKEFRLAKQFFSGSRARTGDIGFRKVHPHDSVPSPRQLERVPAKPAGQVKDALVATQVEGLHDKVNFAGGAFHPGHVRDI